MTVLKYDDVIKKSRDLDYYFGIFWKISCSMRCFIARAYLVQDLCPPGYLMSKKPRLVRVKSNSRLSNFIYLWTMIKTLQSFIKGSFSIKPTKIRKKQVKCLPQVPFNLPYQTECRLKPIAWTYILA